MKCKNTNENTGQDLTPKAKGLRLKKAITSSFLGSKAFSQKYGFNYATLKSWLSGLHGGIPMRRAVGIAKALEAERIGCNPEWIMYGIGQEPYHIDTNNSRQLSPTFPSKTDTEEQRIAKELDDFCQYYKNAVYLTVADDGLFPCYRQGDLVAGIKYFEKDIRKLVNLDCIVQLEGDDTLLLRNICQGTTKDTYTLACRNKDSTAKKAVLYDVKLISAAPVIWVRRQTSKLYK
jgi:HTH-type transcriptional regulator, cell division transcriptional repressor